jgi:hypothetical protein
MHDRTIWLPAFITFSTDPYELDDREGEPSPTQESLLAYSQRAVRLDVDTECQGQPEGAVFAAAGIDWDAAGLIDDAETGVKLAAFRKLLTACQAVVERWDHGDLAEAARMCSEAVTLALKRPA